jgi:hypothetical protein
VESSVPVAGEADEHSCAAGRASVAFASFSPHSARGAQLRLAHRAPPVLDDDERLELSADAAADFVWPHESLPPLRYASVLLVVERMPRVSENGAAGRPRELPPWRHLWINGRLLPRA